MLKNYLLVAFRTLRRNPAYAAIHLVGLAVGIAACLLIGLYVEHELSFDRFHADADRLYRVDYFSERTEGEGNPYVELETAEALQEEIPQIETVTRVFGRGPQRLKHETEVATEVQSGFVDASFFDLFSFPVVEGRADRLAEPFTAVIDRDLAARVFGTEPAVGQVIEVESYGSPAEVQVVGVMDPMPSNTHLAFNLVLSMGTLEAALGENFWANHAWTYARLRPGTEVADIEPALARVAERFASSDEYRLAAHAVPDLHLYHSGPRSSDPRVLMFFGAIAGLILLIACANYVNLASARTAQRAHEVGVRKALGAGRRQLAGQFLGEAVVLSVLAVPLALALTALALPSFNALAETAIDLNLADSAGLLAVLVATAIGVGLVAGAYPAFLLTRFEPVRVLRDRLPRLGSSTWVRKAFVLGQFVVTAFLLYGTAVVLQQLRYVQTTDLGFDKEHVVAIPLASAALAESAGHVKETFLSVPGVEHASLASGLPMMGLGGMRSIFDVDGREVTLAQSTVDPDFAETLGLEFVAGRTFDPRRAVDSTAFVLNEAAARAYGFAEPGDAVGETVEVFDEPFTVIGVVEDFHFATMRTDILPLAMQLGPWRSVVALRVSGSLADVVPALGTAWDELAPGEPLDLQFLDEAVARQYEAERRIAKLLGVFGGLAMLLACLGLFGMAAYTVQRRTKEIGIRKVLGATVAHVVTLVSREFAVLVGLAVVLAAPLAWWATSLWLDGFAYRAPVGAGLFTAVAGAALAVALGTVAVHAVRAALADPAQTIRYE